MLEKEYFYSNHKFCDSQTMWDTYPVEEAVLISAQSHPFRIQSQMLLE